MNNTFHVTTFGDFTITCGDRSVSDRLNRSKKPWNMIEYLIINHDRTASQDEMLTLLWTDDPADSSLGALKVLLHRSRKYLEGLCPDGKQELLILRKGEYFWSDETDLVIDSEEFDELLNKASVEKNRTRKQELLEQAVGLYSGNFLSNNSENWVAPIAEHYRSLYLEAVFSLTEIYLENSLFGETSELCKKAITIEPDNEELYYNLINSLYKSGRQQEALETYNSATDSFYRKFGITPSAKLKSLYRTIVSTTKALETDIGIIRDSLTEPGEAEGAFFSEYEFFKDIYQLEARACARSGDSIYLGLITLSEGKDEKSSSKHMNKAMDELFNAINDTLRKGDVFSRYSLSQFVLLLPSTSFENVEMVMKRISSSFFRKYTRKDIELSYRAQPLEPKA